MPVGGRKLSEVLPTWSGDFRLFLFSDPQVKFIHRISFRLGVFQFIDSDIRLRKFQSSRCQALETALH
jgi:hypothetical protein